MTLELQVLTQRLEAVEKQVAHLAALVVEQSEDTDRTVVARSFVVRDRQGQRKAELGTVIRVGQTEESPWLGLFDDNQTARACMGVSAEGPWLQLCSAKGQAVAEVMEDQGGPRVSLFDASGNIRISLYLSDGGSFASLFSSDGKQHLRLELFSRGQASLVMKDANGDTSLLAATHSDTGPVLVLFKGDDVIWKAP